jgi:hypothetical protein
MTDRDYFAAAALSRGSGCGGTDKPVTLPATGTGNTQTAPPCVETDGPPSKGEGLSEAEIDALEFAVETGRVATHDADTLRNLLARLP